MKPRLLRLATIAGAVLACVGNAAATEREDARAMVERREFAPALEIYGRLVRQHPDDSDLAIEAARVLGWADRNKESAQAYEHAAKRFPHRRPDVLVAMAWQHLWAGQAAQAVPLFREALAASPDERTLMLGLAQAQRDSDQLPAALETYTRLIERRDDAPAREGRAALLARMGRWREAVADYEAARRSAPDAIVARAMVEQREFARASDIYQRLKAQNPDDSDLAIESARVLGWADRNKESAQAYEDILVRFPKRRADVLPSVAWQHLWAGAPAAAAGRFREALQIRSGDREMRRGYATALAESGSLDESLRVWDALIAEQPDDVRARTGRAAALARYERWRDAANEYDALMKIAPDDPAARSLGERRDLPRGLAEQRDYGRALAIYARLQAQYPNDPDLAIEAARVQGWADQHRESAQSYAQAAQRFPERRGDLAGPMAWQLLWADEAGAAVGMFREALASNPADRDLRIGLAQALRDSGEAAESGALYDALVREQPDDVRARKGRAVKAAREERWRQAALDYESALRANPADTEAKVGLAKSLNQSGRHRAAAHMYDELLRDLPADDGLRVQRAQALYWAGYDPEARRALEGVPGNEATALRDQLDRSFAPSGTVGYERSHDSDDLTIQRLVLEGAKPVGESGRIGVSYAHARLDGFRRRREFDLTQSAGAPGLGLALNGIPNSASRVNNAITPNVLNVDLADGRSLHVPVGNARQSFLSGDWNESGSMDGDRAEVEYSDRFGGVSDAHGPLFGRAAVGLRNYGGWSTVSWRAGLKWLPADLWRLDLEAGNDIVENLPSIDNRVRYNYVGAGVEFRPAPRWTVAGGYSRGRFDDGNNRDRVRGRLEYLLPIAPRVSVGVDALLFNDSRQAVRDFTVRLDPTAAALAGVPSGAYTAQEVGRGYYNPHRYQEWKVFANWVVDRPTWSLNTRGAVGRIFETPWGGGDTHSNYLFGELDYRYRINAANDLRAVLGRTESRLSSSGSGGYSLTYGGIYLIHRFGYPK